jgi:hypothetical protein
MMAAFTANSWLSVASLLLLIVMAKLLWRPGEPPILLYAGCYQWMQACILTFEGNFKGLNIDDMGYSQAITQAAWLSLAGLLMVCLGMRVGGGGSYAKKSQESAAAIAAQMSVKKLFVACLVAIVAANFLTILGYSLPGLRQPLLALSLLHWVFVYLLTYTVFSRHRGYAALGIIFVIELAVGFLGFFSGFKTVLIVVFIAVMAAPYAMRGVKFRSALAIGAVILALAVVWTGIKKEYRQFLNDGTQQQVVLVSVGDRVDKLMELVSALDGEKLDIAISGFIERLTYVHFFGESIRTVPSRIPFEDGKLWGEAIQVALVPRLINPNKIVLDDSKRTAYYTGNRVAGSEDGASISLGYVAESYIDFGPWLMMPVLFLWGIAVGLSYRILVRSGRFPLFGYACATIVIFLNASVLESSNTKMVGGLILGLGAMYLVQKYFARRLLRMVALKARFNPDAA